MMRRQMLLGSGGGSSSTLVCTACMESCSWQIQRHFTAIQLWACGTCGNSTARRQQQGFGFRAAPCARLLTVRTPAARPLDRQSRGLSRQR